MTRRATGTTVGTLLGLGTANLHRCARHGDGWLDRRTSSAGIAITANDATAAQGNWQYTLNGTSWVDIPTTGLSNSNGADPAVDGTALRFVPEPRSGTARRAALTVHV